jgi:hypothetical protein
VQTVEIGSPDEARRSRLAQYSGRPAKLTLNGSTILCVVRSVKEDRSDGPKRWIVTIIPQVEKPEPVRQRYKSPG